MPLHTRTLGATNVALSEITLGTWGLSGANGPLQESVVRQTIEAALEAGVTTFDTAPLWGGGATESLLGELLETRRKDVQLITRAGAVVESGAEGPEIQHRFDPDALERDLHQSLDRLRTDHVDVWLLHDPPEEALSDPTWKEKVEKLREAKKFRAFGVSTGSIDVARLAIGLGVDALCMPFNLLCSDDVDDLVTDLQGVASAESPGRPVGLIARSPLQHGLLAGRWTEYRQFSDQDHRKARWTPRALTIRVRQVSQLRYLVHDDITSLAQAAVRFVLSSPVVTTCALGARRPIQIRDAERLAGEAPYLPDADLARLGQVLAAVGA